MPRTWGSITPSEGLMGRQGPPPEYLPTGKWPRFAPEQVIMLRRSNCRAFFPQLAKWYGELSQPTIHACRRVGQAVTIALRHF
eukprot:5130863-Alexandrium_andersonii.AAC.1